MLNIHYTNCINSLSYILLISLVILWVCGLELSITMFALLADTLLVLYDCIPYMHVNVNSVAKFI